MSDDAIQDLLDECVEVGDMPMSCTVARARVQHAASRSKVAELTSALEGRAVEVAQMQGWIATHKVDLTRIAMFRERAERSEAEVAELQKQLAGSLEERAALAHEIAELKADEDFADGVIVSLTVDVAELRKKVAELTAARDKEFARAEEWRATVADLSRQYALGEDVAALCLLAIARVSAELWAFLEESER